MASSRKHHPGTGLSDEAVLPSSTAAAQLVNVYKNREFYRARTWPTSFEQLLTEILKTGDEPGASNGTVEHNVDINSKVIVVVVEAAFHAIQFRNPFEENNDKTEQMHAILKVIALTIQHHPEVMFHCSSGQGTVSNLEKPLYLWLLPKIYLLSLKVDSRNYHHGILAVLQSAILAGSSMTSGSFRYPLKISRYIQMCFQDTLDFLERQVKAVVKAGFQIPSVGTLHHYHETSDAPLTGSSGYQISISNTRTALQLATTFSNALFKASLRTNISGPVAHLLRSEVTFTMLGRFWQILKNSGSKFTTETTLQHAIVSCVDAFRASLSVILKEGRETSGNFQTLYYLQGILQFLLFFYDERIIGSLHTALSHLLLDILFSFQRQVSNLLVAQHALSHIALDTWMKSPKLSEDLRTILLEIQTLRTCNHAVHNPPQRKLTLSCHGLQSRFQDSFPASRSNQEEGQPRKPPKRARLTSEDSSNESLLGHTSVLKRICESLGLTKAVEIDRLKHLILDRVPHMTEDQQIRFYTTLGSSACQSVVKVDSQKRGISSVSTTLCSRCGLGLTSLTPHGIWNGALASSVEESMTGLLQLSQAQKSRRTKVTAMLAARRIAAHSSNQSVLCMSTSIFGQWCLQALRSSTRQLRIAAGRSLYVFLRDDIDYGVLSKNRVRIFDYLYSLSTEGDLTLQESCVLAWGQLARVCDADERNVVLLRLVEYLGHKHQIICTLAYNELQATCRALSITPYQMLNPYWRTIAPTVVNELRRRPQVIQLMAELLSITTADFLQLTQVHTIPYLVLNQRREILSRVAESSGLPLRDMCLLHNNLASILAHILLKTSGDLKASVSSVLGTISSDFSGMECAELIRAEPILIASELLKVAGECLSQDNPEIHAALQFLASVTCGRQPTSRTTARKTDSIGPFFDFYILGILAHLTNTINDGRVHQSLPEKRRCLGAIRAMMDIAGNNISSALPQISACLQAAMAQEQMCNEALEAWNVMLQVVSEDQIVILIHPTFAIVNEYWSRFDTTRQSGAYLMISRLLKTHSAVVRKLVNHIPSLGSIPLMSKFEEEIGRLKAQTDVRHHYIAFTQRCQDENAVVVKRALVELETYLYENQGVLHSTAVNEQPDGFVSELIRALLDSCIRFEFDADGITTLSARCLGVIGCLDSTRIEAVREENTMLLLSNFSKAEETTNFLVFFIRKVLVQAFLSATNLRSQGFLAYAMQELLRFCQFDKLVPQHSHNAPYNNNYIRWMELPESLRNMLSPFLASKYVVTPGLSQAVVGYPIYKQSISHGHWLRSFSFDLLQKGTGDNVELIFPVLSKIVRLQDVSVSSFLLPYLVLNVVIGGTEDHVLETGHELLKVLESPLADGNSPFRDALLSCSQSVFDILDYLFRWMHEKKKEVAVSAGQDIRRNRTSSSELDLGGTVAQIERIETISSMIPTETISHRAVECRSFARALLHWEQYIRQRNQLSSLPSKESQYLLYNKLQDIYTQIDEPDGIEGISSHLKLFDIEQQVLEHRKAGRWTAVQSWYELRLNERPDDGEVQLRLLSSLKASGQHDVLLNQVSGFEKTPESLVISLPFAAEAAWVTSRWAKLRVIVDQARCSNVNAFNIGVASALIALLEGRSFDFLAQLGRLQHEEAKKLSPSNTINLQSCHETMLKLHVLTEMDIISGVCHLPDIEKSKLLMLLDQRLAAVGAFFVHKQYILGLRRASMELSKRPYLSSSEVSLAWLTSAKLARKGGFTHQAFNAVLHAARLGDESATVENARLLWAEGHHRKAIQNLEGAIAANAFQSHDYTLCDNSLAVTDVGADGRQNLPKGRAYLLLAKWIDRAGQTQSDHIIKRYHKAVESNQRWEKGHYYLGRHYNKLLESEKAKPPERQSQPFITGETAKLVIENYLRALCFGAKYMHQTLPRILTLWLQLGTDVEQPLNLKYGNDEKFLNHVANQRRRLLTAVHAQLKKYVDRLPAFVFYTALSQVMARICHSNQAVYSHLVDIIVKVVSQHPQQALWMLLATVKSSVKERASRGHACILRVVEASRRFKNDALDLKNLVTQCQRLSEQLLRVCEGAIVDKSTHISITKDLGFNHRLAPCKIVVPLEATLTAKLPPVIDRVQMRSHRAFSKETVTISSFLEDVLVLSSLQKPRKISVRGSDGNVYALLCKPKDDLRKDQRLMEFNGMINRALKRDSESSRRRLYIRTYAVTPLNEECGLIEWVDKLKPLRDILLSTYRQKGISINYQELRKLLDQACREHDVSIFTDRILTHFPPAFHEWFVELFPEPSSWFEARLRYTRSCAVMSIVGHVLGLGDRHGENILFEEGNGGTLHVDFNCLFDKGLTFEKPEVVPFRLTQNMVDAFGAYGYEGPFRKSSELTLSILRNDEDSLMTILETFLYDPTTDFMGGKRRKNSERVPETPEGVLETIRNKVRGMLDGESVPLSVDGYIQKLIEEATDPWNLCQMYIGWCAFF